MLHKLWFRALASSAPWFPRPPCQRVSRGRLRSFRIAGLTALPPGWQHPAWSRTWLRVPPGQGDSTVCPCARLSVRVTGPASSLLPGDVVLPKELSWLQLTVLPPVVARLYSFMAAFSQLDPLRCSCSPSPPLPCPWSSLVGRAPWEMGLWRWDSLVAAPSPRAHFLPLFLQLAERGAAPGRPSPQDVLSTKELPVTGDDDNPGGTSESTNVSVAQHPWVAASPSFSTPLPPIAPGWCINQGEPRFFSPRPSTFGSSGICMAAA